MRHWPAQLATALRPAFVDKVDRDHRQSNRAFLYRRVVVGIVLVIGATLLGLSLSVRPGDATFYPLTFSLAAAWLIGGFVSGPLHLGWIPGPNRLRRPVIVPILTGAVATALFVVGALIVREIGPLRQLVNSVLAYERFGTLPLVLLTTVVNGIAEEVFFRGALFAAIGSRYPVLISTVIYGLATVASGNPMLVFAALLLGAVLGLQRRASGGVLGPILTHVTWSTSMLFILPALF